jgi:hypothetical protein
MTTLQITLPVSQEELLQVVEQLDSEDLDEFASRVQALRAERRSDVLLPAEAELIKQIDLGIAPETWKRYEFLTERLEDELLTEAEHQELLAIITQIEAANARRFEALVKLALLRQVSFDSLLKEFGITNPSHE